MQSKSREYNKRTSIAFRSKIASAVVIGALLLTVTLEYLSVMQVHKMRNRVLDLTLPITLDTMQMRDQLHLMNSSLLSYVSGHTEKKDEFNHHLSVFKTLRSSVNSERELDGIDNYIGIVSKLANSVVFAFDSSSNEKNKEEIYQTIKNSIQPLEAILEYQETTLREVLDSERVDERTAKAYILNQEMLKQIQTAAYELQLIKAKSADAATNFSVSLYKLELAMNKSANILISAREKVRQKEMKRLLSKIRDRGNEIITRSDIEGYFDAMLAIEKIETFYFPSAKDVLTSLSIKSRNEVRSSLDELQRYIKLFETINSLTIAFAVSIILMYLLYLQKQLIAPITRTSENIVKLRSGHRNLDFDRKNKLQEIYNININLDNFQQELLELDTLREQQLSNVQKEHLAQLQNANESLAQFVHIASHDLRSPLRNIANLSLILEEEINSGADQSATSELCLRISEQSFSACRLVDDLKTLASLEHTEIEYDEVDTEALLRDVINEASDILEGRESTLKTTSMPTLSVSKALFRQVFVNLIRNAILHTKGPLHINIGAAHIESSNRWRYTISNNTQRAVADSSKLLLPFVKGPDSKNGTGMGLAICKRILDLHNGSIWIDEIKDDTFTVHFEIPDAHKKEEHPFEEQPAPIEQATPHERTA